MNQMDKPSIPEVHAFKDLLPALPIMPDENSMEIETIKNSLLKDLAPNSAYQHIIAQNIIANELEIFRLRRWLKVLIMASTEEQLSSEIDGTLTGDEEKEKGADHYVKSVMEVTPEQYPIMSAWLHDHRIDLTRILALAYSDGLAKFAYLERRILLLEASRGRLRTDYNAVRDIRKTSNINYEYPNG